MRESYSREMQHSQDVRGTYNEYMLSAGVHNMRSEWGMCGFSHGDLDAFEPTYNGKLYGGDGPLNVLK